MMKLPTSAGSRFMEAERQSAFRQELTRMARSGMRAAGIVGVIGVAVFVASSLLVGRTPTFTYGDYRFVIVLWDKLVLVALAAAAFALAPYASLAAARSFMAAMALIAAFASVSDDVVGGDTSFAAGYVILFYMLVVAATPFRPVHVAALGVGLAGVIALAVELGPVLFGAPETKQLKGHFVYMSMLTVLMTGIGWLLYTNRWAQHKARLEAEELRDSVRMLEAAKDRFFANVSHELRTPLTLLAGPVDDALAGRFGAFPAPMVRRLEVMQTQTRQLRRLIDQLLELARLDAGRVQLSASETDLAMFVRRHTGFFSAAAERAGVDLVCECTDSITAWIDPERIGSALDNLLSNALKYTPTEGSIRVRVAGEERDEGRGFATISVRDTGPGISPDMLPTIFDRFASSSVGGTASPSTGIGLALVRELVERHGGTVEVESEPRFGTTFTIRIPLGKDHLQPSDLAILPEVDEEEEVALQSDEADHLERDQESGEVAAESAPLVLVVDDDEALRTYVAELLLPSYRIVEATNGGEAVCRLSEERPALIISDVMMPVMDGYALCRHVKEDPGLASVPVILLTAWSEEEDRLRGLRTGADAYLAKPFSSSELLLIVENLIEIRRMLSAQVTLPDWMAEHVPAVPSYEARFLERAQQIVGEHLSDHNFGVDWLAAEVGLSTRQFQRRMKALTRLTAAGFVKTMRFERAAQLFRETDYQVCEVARAVGYEDANYFSSLFHQAYGVSPSEYARSVRALHDDEMVV